MSERPTLVRAPAALERYVDVVELAEIMGVSTRTIFRFVEQGMPSENWGMKRTRRFSPSDCIAWARRRSSTIDRSRDRDSIASQHDNRRE